MTMLIALHALLVAGRADDHPVWHDGKRFVSWQEFSSHVAARADYFTKRPEPRWLLAADHPPDFAILLLALLHAGKRVVIPPNTQAGTLAHLANAFDAIAAADLPAGKAAPLAPMDPHAALIDLYTSGSTGEPKHVRKTLAQFEAEIVAQESQWGNALGKAAIVATSPHQHIYGLLFRLLWPLSAGRPFDSVTCAYPDMLRERLAMLGESGNCALVSSPAQLSRLPELVALASLQPAPAIIFSSGGPLPAAAAAAFHRHLGQAPTEIFGSTETGGIAWRRQDGGVHGDSWLPLPGITVAMDEDGALSVHSPFLPGIDPWRMDDAVELLPGGRFRLRGRLDRVVKIEDKRLSLPDLEARICEHPWVAAAAAVALDGRRQTVGAALALTPQGLEQLATQGRRSTIQQLRRHLGAHFEAVLLPRRWRFPERLPLNERGKLTEAALTALFSVENDEPVPALRAGRAPRRGK